MINTTFTSVEVKESNLFDEHGSPNRSYIFDVFLDIYKRHKNYSILTTHTNDFASTTESFNLPRRICGDWNSKLKLLRYQSHGPILGLHFISDYLHHFGGYKAKISVRSGKILP